MPTPLGSNSNEATLRNVGAIQVRQCGCAECSQSAGVFRHAVLASPDVIAGQVDVLPTERGEVRQQLIRNVHSSLAEGDYGTLEISGVP